jgi:hypothetical protein
MWNAHKWLSCPLNLSHFPVCLTSGVLLYYVYERLIKYASKTSELSSFMCCPQLKVFANMKYIIAWRMFIIEMYVRKQAYNQWYSKFRNWFPSSSDPLK